MLSEKIKAKRTEKGLSQEELANKLSVVRQTVSKWEKGLSVPDSNMLILIADVLDTTVAQLVDEVEKPPATAKKRKLDGLTLALIIIGFPLWFSLLMAVFSVYVSLWAVIVSLWVVFGSLAGTPLLCLITAIISIYGGSFVKGMALLGLGLASAGFAAFLFFGCRFITASTAKLTKNFILWIKRYVTERWCA